MMAYPKIYWITGLPASGKTTLAVALHQALQAKNTASYVLDGDELRRGLCADLGLSPADRSENIRRAGEVARLMTQAGLTAICAFVSPFEADRQRVRALCPGGQFIEIHLSTSMQECARRDPKGLYAKAKSGQLIGMTGWDAPYERPSAPEFEFNTEKLRPEDIVQTLLQNH